MELFGHVSRSENDRTRHRLLRYKISAEFDSKGRSAQNQKFWQFSLGPRPGNLDVQVLRARLIGSDKGKVHIRP